MRCEYNDGFRVSYGGPLRIKKGNEVNVYLDSDEIPSEVWGELHEATLDENCGLMRHAAQEITEIVGTYLPEDVQKRVRFEEL